ncbi:MAG: NADH-quinone oxidoreductase subunit J family protein [Lacipirellulaceae bacterium]
MALPSDNVLIVVFVATAAVGLWLAMAQRRYQTRYLGVAIATAALLGVLTPFDAPGGELVEQVQFWLYGACAIAGGVSMIASRDPVHGALWFAVATLAVCGLFLLQSAPFLAAATVIVYAGAIIVTFLFVIMLAQQNGVAAYDRNPRRPTLAIAVSAVILGTLLAALYDLHRDGGVGVSPKAVAASTPPAPGAPPEKLGAVHALGRSLFVDHLLAVELGGTLLLVATAGAILLAPRRASGTL